MTIPPDRRFDSGDPRSDVWSLPLDFHCHGIDPWDVSNLTMNDLIHIQAALKKRASRAILTAYLLRGELNRFEASMREFARAQAELPNIAGIAIEGPLLARTGGIPEQSKWVHPPTRAEWGRIVALGELGLSYVVISPNADTPVPIEEIIELLLDHGIRPALGHFGKDADPRYTAAAIGRVLEVARRLGGAVEVVSDHLFNDMPVNIPYAWRNDNERLNRHADLATADLASITFENLEERIGAVPATLLRGARDGLLTVCLNFDRMHVDPEICRWVIDLIGPDSLLAMTDRAALNGIANLEEVDGILWATKDGKRVVAAGAWGMDRQLETLRSHLELDERMIYRITVANPARVLRLPEPSAVKLLAVDVDGTLLDSQHQLTHRTEEALRRAMNAGIQVVLTTGKTRKAVAEIIDSLSLSTPGAYVQGAVLQDGDGVVFSQHTLPAEVAAQVGDFARESGLHLVAFAGTKILAEELNPHTRRFVDHREPEPTLVSSPALLRERSDLNKLVVLGESKTIDTRRPELEAAVGEAAVVVQAVPGMLEVLPHGVSKGAGLREILALLDLPPSQVMAIGDAENDIELLAAAGIGVAVGNAVPKLKEIADWVVASNDEDGVAEAIDRLLHQTTAADMRAPNTD